MTFALCVRYRHCLLIYVCVAVSFSLHASDLPVNQSLHDLQVATYQRLTQGGQLTLNDSQINSLQRWLASAPVLDISALTSNQQTGTDEYEISLNFALRMPDAKQAWDQIEQLGEALTDAQVKQQQLVISGLVRESVWRVLLAQQEVQLLSDKQGWMQQLGEQLQREYDAGVISKLALLTWQQQRVSIQRDIVQAELALQSAQNNFTQLTGKQDVPQDVFESAINDTRVALNQHPEVRLLIMQRQYNQAAFEYSKMQNANINLGIIARRLDSPQFSEDLIGLSLGVPLGTSQFSDISDQQNYRQNDLMLSQALANLRQTLLSQVDATVILAQTQTQQIDLVRQQVELGQSIIEQLTQLRGSSEVDQARWLEAQVEQRDREYELELLQLQRYQLNSQINQLSGQSL